MNSLEIEGLSCILSRYLDRDSSKTVLDYYIIPTATLHLICVKYTDLARSFEFDIYIRLIGSDIEKIKKVSEKRNIKGLLNNSNERDFNVVSADILYNTDIRESVDTFYILEDLLEDYTYNVEEDDSDAERQGLLHRAFIKELRPLFKKERDIQKLRDDIVDRRRNFDSQQRTIHNIDWNERDKLDDQERSELKKQDKIVDDQIKEIQEKYALIGLSEGRFNLRDNYPDENGTEIKESGMNNGINSGAINKNENSAKDISEDDEEDVNEGYNTSEGEDDEKDD